MDYVAERIASAVISAVLGLIIVLALLFWVNDLPVWAFPVVPLACALAGYVAGHRAVEVFKEVVTWI